MNYLIPEDFPPHLSPFSSLVSKGILNGTYSVIDNREATSTVQQMIAKQTLM